MFLNYVKLVLQVFSVVAKLWFVHETCKKKYFQLSWTPSPNLLDPLENIKSKTVQVPTNVESKKKLTARPITLKHRSYLNLFHCMKVLKNSLISVSFHSFILGTVYQTMRNSLYYRSTAEQTDSLDFIKMIKVTSNVNQLKSSNTNKKIKVITSIPYPAQSQIHVSGRD